jgi:hypothetical protein
MSGGSMSLTSISLRTEYITLFNLKNWGASTELKKPCQSRGPFSMKKTEFEKVLQNPFLF